MQEFRIKPETFAGIRRKTLIGSILLATLVAATVLILSQYTDGEIAWDLSYIRIAIPMAAVVLGISIFRGMQRQKKALESFRLTVEDNVITREVANTEEMTIYFHEVKEIIRLDKKGTLAIKGFDKTDIICVPYQVEKYAELEALLQQIKPFTAPKAAYSIVRKLSLPLVIAQLALMATLYISKNKILVAISGILVAAFQGWVIYKIYRSKNVNKTAKNRLWVLALVFIAVIGFTIFKLFFDNP